MAIRQPGALDRNAGSAVHREAAGELGVEAIRRDRCEKSPTVAESATNTLKLPEYALAQWKVLNAERDAAVLFATGTDPGQAGEDEPVAGSRPRRTSSRKPPRRAGRFVSGPASRRLVFRRRRCHAGARSALGKMRIDQIEELGSIRSITDGASSRRNQLLVGRAEPRCH